MTAPSDPEARELAEKWLAGSRDPLSADRILGNPNVELLSRALLASLDREAALAAALMKLQGGTDHPEDRCEKCGGRNVVWFTDSKIWNAAHESFSILCPICFVQMAEAVGFKPPSWKIEPEARTPQEPR